eukprot:TRINITY_DN112963_c0_g1_i1.p1 TRINITY_DN112963_c0_g1~~TRINITY_DN112963_c0_g1_i1.p1  ORF type:complete len:183 (-),score=53.40 TRINITY_DN112963_c0_g1_i1:196-744(-)
MLTIMASLLSLSCFFHLSLVCAGPVDNEYQRWAAKTYKPDDKEAVERGNTMACVLCNLLTKTVIKTHKLNLEKPREERFTEEQTQDVLLDFCEQISPNIAKKMNGYTQDLLMICKRTVRENIGDMIDAASLGEDVTAFCKEQGLCQISYEGMEKMQELMLKFAESEAKKQEQEKIEQNMEEL